MQRVAKTGSGVCSRTPKCHVERYLTGCHVGAASNAWSVLTEWACLYRDLSDVYTYSTLSCMCALPGPGFACETRQFVPSRCRESASKESARDSEKEWARNDDEDHIYIEDSAPATFAAILWHQCTPVPKLERPLSTGTCYDWAWVLAQDAGPAKCAERSWLFAEARQEVITF